MIHGLKRLMAVSYIIHTRWDRLCQKVSASRAHTMMGLLATLTFLLRWGLSPPSPQSWLQARSNSAS